MLNGDTIKAEIDGSTFTVDYIGIDVPNNGERFLYESTVKNGEYVYGKTVTLVKDIADANRDGQLNRYVLTDDVFVNWELVYQGYAIAKDNESNISYHYLFNLGEADAYSDESGHRIQSMMDSSSS